ncbi:MAG: DNA repair protein RecO [Desulfotomaculaceae bacterium]|nr:DNA repair protein RecO [Desulfotomaculaceae bacterium]
MKLYKADAIVLRSRDCGEGNRILVLYSREYGKIRVMAHGVAKPSSRKRGAVQLFSHTNFLIHHGRELDSVSQCEVVEMFPALRGDLGGISRASYMAELVDIFTPEGEPNEPLFLLLLTTLRLLAVKEPELLIRAFEIKAMGLLGYSPVLNACASCGAQLQGPLSFSPAMGGVLCSTCNMVDPDTAPCNRGLVEILKILANWEPSRLHLLKVEGLTRKQLRTMLQKYIRYHLEGELKSAAFLSRYGQD